jgi:hypothetical protein
MGRPVAGDHVMAASSRNATTTLASDTPLFLGRKPHRGGGSGEYCFEDGQAADGLVKEGLLVVVLPAERATVPARKRSDRLAFAMPAEQQSEAIISWQC